MKFSILKVASVAALSLLTAASQAASVFSVNENVIDPTATLQFGANTTNLIAIDGTYTERLVLTSATTFATVALFQLNTLIDNSTNTAVAGAALNNTSSIGSFTTNAYKLYGIFTATGNISTAATGEISFTGATSSFSIFSDRDSNTSAAFTTPAASNLDPSYLNFSVSNTTDNQLLGRSNRLIGGDGTFTPTSAAFGNFAILFDQLDGDGNTGNGLTTLGKSYFYSPDPFYAVVRTSGQFDRFTLPAVGAGAEFTGNLRVSFDVPEPTSLALAGLALVGLAVAGRRKA